MKITKYEHSCVVIEEAGDKLVIDPGEGAVSLTDLNDVAVIVVTHTHGDHLDVEKVKAIIKANPEVKIFTVSDYPKDQLDSNIMVVTPNSSRHAGAFRLEFTGGKHAAVHSSFPVFENVGVCVNETFYYAGDSFTLPGRRPKVLAVPAQAPWMKSGEAMDYLLEVKPMAAFPTHNGYINEAGQGLADHIFGAVAKPAGIDYKFLNVGESITV